MKTYRINVVVDYDYEVEAESLEEAEKMAWQYQEFPFHASVYSVDIYEENDEVDEDE